MPNSGYGAELIETANNLSSLTEQTVMDQIKNMNDRKEKNRKSNWGVGHVNANSNEDKYAVHTSANQAFREDLIKDHKKTMILAKDTTKLYMGS